MSPKLGVEPLRREQILNAAFEVIAERSLEATRMRDIAASAGVSHPSLHYYFNTKDQLIVALLDRLLAQFLNGVEERLAAAGTPVARLRVLLEQQKRLIEEHKDRLEVYYDFWVQATKRPIVRRKIREMYSSWRGTINRTLDDGVKQGQFRADRVPQAEFLLVSLFQGAALQSIVDPANVDLGAYFDQVDRFIVHFLSDE
jgi:AcrR family transcriptional regulator